MIIRVRGYLKIFKNNRSIFWLSIYIGIISLLWCCKSSEEAENKTESPAGFKEFLAKYEKTFNPADFDLSIDSIHFIEKKQQEALQAAEIVTLAPPETISGFRVQVLFTPDIEQANQMRDTLSILLPEEWIYIVYDSPYYKVRVGNYIDRTAASVTIKKLIDLGFNEPWIVPDKIIKNPPPHPPDIFITPEKQPE